MDPRVLGTLPCDEQVTVETDQPQYSIIKPRPISSDIQLYNIIALNIPERRFEPKISRNRACSWDISGAMGSKGWHALRNKPSPLTAYAHRMRRCFPRSGDFLQHMSASALRKSLGNLNQPRFIHGQAGFIDLSTWV